VELLCFDGAFEASIRLVAVRGQRSVTAASPETPFVMRLTARRIRQNVETGPLPKIKPTNTDCNTIWNLNVAEVPMSFFFHSNFTLRALAVLGTLVSDNHNSNAQKPVQSDIDLSDIASILGQSYVSASPIAAIAIGRLHTDSLSLRRNGSSTAWRT
jgi:hypothetical protein